MSYRTALYFKIWPSQGSRLLSAGWAVLGIERPPDDDRRVEGSGLASWHDECELRAGWDQLRDQRL